MIFHIEYPRIIPERRLPGHQPAAPRYTLRWDRPISTLVSQYHAMQLPELSWEMQREFFDAAKRSFLEEDGPVAHEIMRFVDEAGYLNAVVASYWTDPNSHDRWMRNSSFSGWFNEEERQWGEAGYWRETIAVPYDRHETTYSAKHYRIGLGRTPGSSIESMTTNGYFGAARDRLPISAIDPLESAFAEAGITPRRLESRRRRLFALTPHNMTALRSGQFWEAAQTEQLEDYMQNLQPKLMRGMDYLRENKELSGTLTLRVMTNINADGTDRAETSVLGYFASLEQLEDWSKSHETHLDIYRHAIAMNKQYGEKREVVTWHELFVMPSTCGFEYINCHPGTGLLPFCRLLEVAE